MDFAKISVETLTVPTYPEGAREEMPMFLENRHHQLTSGRVYPNKVSVHVDRSRKEDVDYIGIHMENKYLDIWIMPQIGGRIFSAQDKTNGYDFFYRQHVIKPALIGALGSWISGGVEFNWPYHHRASGFMPCDYRTEECEDGSVICWLSETEPVDRMKGMVGIVLRPDSAYLETRVKLANTTPVRHSFLWWENAAVAVHEQYQIFFPHDVSYVNFHYLESRTTYPIAGGNIFNGTDMSNPRDISMHKNSRNGTSYFACASNYDFFGGYDHSKQAGVVHIGDHHISPGKKMFTWGYDQLSRTWENALTDTDGQYAELMAATYSDNQPNFTWLEPYETKEFSEYWYPIREIGTPDYANLDCAARLTDNQLMLQSTGTLGKCHIAAVCSGKTVLETDAVLNPCAPIFLPWTRPQGLVTLTVTDAQGREILFYREEKPELLKIPPLREPMPFANEVHDADTLYQAGLHVDLYRDPVVMPDAYWMEALKRNPDHADSLLGMARYCYNMYRLEDAKKYAEHAIRVLTRYNERLENGEPYYMYALILEALEDYDGAYNYYYKSAWCSNCVAKAMGRISCLDLRRGNPAEALRHAGWALRKDAMHPLVPAIRMLADPDHAREIAGEFRKEDPLNNLVNYLYDPRNFFRTLLPQATPVAMDLTGDLAVMGRYDLCVRLLEDLIAQRPDQANTMVYYALAYYQDVLGADCAQALALAEKAPVGLTFPSRLQEAKILRFAVSRGSHQAIFLLGCLLYDKRHYEEAAACFTDYTQAEPQDYMGWRCLSVACFSHLNRKNDALTYMRKALALSDSDQLTFEAVRLMDMMNVDPREKVSLMTSRPMDLDNICTELAKAYNQLGQPEKALETLMSRNYVACEGGEHAIAEQYMFALYLQAKRLKEDGKPDQAAVLLRKAIDPELPTNLAAGLWYACLRVPYQYALAQCEAAQGNQETANALYRQIAYFAADHFSDVNLPELPFYRALSLQQLGQDYQALHIMNTAKREWLRGFDKVDNGFFDTIAFFVSYVDQAANLRRARYQYLNALVDVFEGNCQSARKRFLESWKLNSDNMFCALAAGQIG